ncbi:lipopolysaccharide heptosyltransferase family protein [candidate division KSB1 bacterium]|nr:MAG: lipopolysaccharide heptosyltransferase family protein [candidate division KSB1 bacterium]
MSGEPTSILVFRNGSIGNTLAAVPALRALHQRFPNAPLNVVVDSAGFQLLELCPWLDRLFIYDKHGADRGLRAQIRLIRQLRAVHPSHTVLFKRFFRNGLLSYLSGAPVRAGFITKGQAPFLNVTIPYEEGVSVVDLNLQLAAALGAVPAGRAYEIFLSDADEKEAQLQMTELHLTNTSFCVAHYGGLTTPPSFVSIPRFTKLLTAIAGDVPVVLTGFGSHETRWANDIAQARPHTFSLCGLPLRTTAALMQRALRFIGFNSGPAHLAAASGCPVVMIFRPDEHVSAEIRKWIPPGEAVHAVVPPASDHDNEWLQFFTSLSHVSSQSQ